MCTTTLDLELALRHHIDALHPVATAPIDAADALVALARIARTAMAGVMILGQRAGEATLWRAKHKPDVGAWMGCELGLSYTDGRRLYDASTLLADAQVTRDLMVAGAIPPLAAAEIVISRHAAERSRARAAARYAAEQARREADAEAAGDEPPTAAEPDLGKTPDQVEQGLADLAQQQTTDLHRLREESERAKAAARDDEDQAEHLLNSRYWRPRLHPDGAPGAGYKSTPEMDAAISAALRGEADRIFRAYRRRGIHATREACLFDALYKGITGHDSPVCPPATAPPPPPARPAPTKRTNRTRATKRPTSTTGPQPSKPAPAAPARPPEGAEPAMALPDDWTADTPPTPAPSTEAEPTSDPPSATPAASSEPQLLFDLPDDADPPLIAPGARASSEVVVRVDAAALHRGFLLAGEICELAGPTPIPIDTARHLAGRARIDIVLDDGDGRVLNVTCAGTRLRRHLWPATGPPPPHPTRLILRIDASMLTPTHTEGIELAGVGRIDPDLLAAVLPARAVELILEIGVDPRTIIRADRHYRRPLDVAFREEHPYCIDCGASTWIERDHQLPVALDGKTCLDNLTGRCPRCHRAKTKKEALRTIRAARRRNTKRRPRGPAAAPPAP